MDVGGGGAVAWIVDTAINLTSRFRPISIKFKCFFIKNLFANMSQKTYYNLRCSTGLLFPNKESVGAAEEAIGAAGSTGLL